MPKFQESPGIQKQSTGMHIFQATLPDQTAHDSKLYIIIRITEYPMCLVFQLWII